MLSKKIYGNEPDAEKKKNHRGGWLLLLADPLGLIAAIFFWPLIIAAWLLLIGLEVFHRSGENEKIEEETLPTMEMIDQLKAEHDKLNQKFEPVDGDQ